MALIGNGRLAFRNPGQYQGTQSNQSGNWIKGGLRNRFVGGFDSTFSAYPSGYVHPRAFVLPEKSGAISSYTLSRGAISPTGTLIPGQPMAASATCSITVTASQLDQIVSLIINATGAISATSTQLAAAASMAMTPSGSIAITPANLGAIISMILNSSGAISPNLTFSALGFIEAEIGGPTPLSPEGLAQAVWNAVLADFQDAGSAGEALGNASAAGNPWEALLADNTTAGTFGKRLQEVLTKNQFLGLK